MTIKQKTIKKHRSETFKHKDGRKMTCEYGGEWDVEYETEEELKEAEKIIEEKIRSKIAWQRYHFVCRNHD